MLIVSPFWILWWRNFSLSGRGLAFPGEGGTSKLDPATSPCDCDFVGVPGDRNFGCSSSGNLTSSRFVLEWPEFSNALTPPPSSKKPLQDSVFPPWLRSVPMSSCFHSVWKFCFEGFSSIWTSPPTLSVHSSTSPLSSSKRGAGRLERDDTSCVWLTEVLINSFSKSNVNSSVSCREESTFLSSKILPLRRLETGAKHCSSSIPSSLHCARTTITEATKRTC